MVYSEPGCVCEIEHQKPDQQMFGLRSESSNVGYLSGDFLCTVSVTDPLTQADKGRPKVALERSEPPKMRPPPLCENCSLPGLWMCKDGSYERRKESVMVSMWRMWWEQLQPREEFRWAYALSSRACCHEATFSKTLAGVFFCCLFISRNGTKFLKNLGRRFHEWKLVWSFGLIYRVKRVKNSVKNAIFKNRLETHPKMLNA